MTTLKYKDAGVWKYLPLGGPSSVPIDAWTTIAGFANNWTAYPGYPPQYRKRPDGIVELRGLVRNGNNGQDCWGVGAIPADCCPDAAVELYFTTMAQTPGPAYTHHDCYIRPNGTLRSLYASWGAQQTGYFSLDGIRYSTAQTTFPTGPQGPIGLTGGNATVAMDPWHNVGAAGEPAFANGWVNNGAPYQVAAFRKDPLGKVQIRGLINGGTINQPAFTLPVGYRPVGHQFFASEGGGAYARFTINATNGTVTPGPGTGSIDLSNCEFDTDSVTAMPTGPTGPQGPTGLSGVARTWRAADTASNKTAPASYGEISSALRNIFTPVATRFYTMRLTSQWEHTSATGYLACQFWDLVGGAAVPGTSFVARTWLAGLNTTFMFEQTVSGAVLAAGQRTITPYWFSTATCTLRSDQGSTTFTITETEAGT